MTRPRQQSYEQQLLRRLLHAFYWLDDGLQAHMRNRAGISLPRAQSMLMVCIGDGIQRQSEMAAHLRVSKQAVQQGIRELEAKGLVEIRPDPAHTRHRVVAFTRDGERLRKLAVDSLRDIERLLARRIGRQRLDALHDALEVDWGPVAEDP
jgi:DNA-binding MarR family transcriptional regulator